MAVDEQNRALMQRISKITQWVGVPQDLKEDLAQEAWILCAQYAHARGRSVDALSNTEIRLRTFEARRKLLTPKQEILVGDITELDNRNNKSGPSYETVLDDIVRSEEVRARCADVNKLEWVLRMHPTLKLTSHQTALWEIYRDNPDGRWKTDRARALGVTRQNVSNIVRVVRKKVEAAADLIRLWEGDILHFFEKYGCELSPKANIDIIRRIIYPRIGMKIPRKMRRAIDSLWDEILAHGLQMLEQEQMMQTLKNGNADRVAIGYHLLETAFLACTTEAQRNQCRDRMQALQDKGILFQCKQMARRNMFASARDEQIALMKEAARKEPEQIPSVIGGDLFFYRNLLFYSVVPRVQWQRYLQSNGAYSFQDLDIARAISGSYALLFDSKYANSTAWQDFNFIRLILMLRYARANIASFPPRSRNTLLILAQKSLHSCDPFVISHAEQLLRELDRKN